MGNFTAEQCNNNLCNIFYYPGTSTSNAVLTDDLNLIKNPGHFSPFYIYDEIMFWNIHMTKIQDLKQIWKKQTDHKDKADHLRYILKLLCNVENKLRFSSPYLKRCRRKKKQLTVADFMKYRIFYIRYVAAVFCSLASEILLLKSKFDKYNRIQYLKWLWKKETGHKDKAELFSHILKMNCN